MASDYNVNFRIVIKRTKVNVLVLIFEIFLKKSNIKFADNSENVKLLFIFENSVSYWTLLLSRRTKKEAGILFIITGVTSASRGLFRCYFTHYYVSITDI